MKEESAPDLLKGTTPGPLESDPTNVVANMAAMEKMTLSMMQGEASGKHTDGPWHVREQRNDVLPTIVRYEIRTEGKLGRLIADINPGMSDHKANAELIASAPATAAELQEAKAEIEKLKEDYGALLNRTQDDMSQKAIKIEQLRNDLSEARKRIEELTAIIIEMRKYPSVYDAAKVDAIITNENLKKHITSDQRTKADLNKQIVQMTELNTEIWSLWESMAECGELHIGPKFSAIYTRLKERYAALHGSPTTTNNTEV